MGALMYASIFGNLTVIIQRLYLQSSKQHEDLRLTRDFVRFYKIPRALQDNLENHVLHESCSMKVSDINNVLSLFPGTLQTDICLHIHVRDFKQGDEVDKVYFIIKGIIHVVADGEILLALGRGDTIYSEYKSMDSQTSSGG
ncbi:hypothetical protein OS493_023777 [Desmophyllum pertusum]|uniref:Cyclic nucleotide-binding domain-containing protein n=1 Tax=Desmophyllum pertusum TaxID=174260 RepID=A0A9X0CJ42_9CNID|nr:hypothetical protein OS493_023777 [Desmophyllum pertusum]